MIEYTPEQSARMAADELRKAARKLAEAQLAVLDALQTLEMFEYNFYKQGSSSK